MKVTILNKGTGPQVVHDSKNRAVQIAVGQSKTVDMHDHIVNRMQKAFKDKKATLKVSDGVEVVKEPVKEPEGDVTKPQLSIAQQSALELLNEADGMNYNDLLQQAKAILPDDAFGDNQRPKKVEVIAALELLANPKQE